MNFSIQSLFQSLGNVEPSIHLKVRSHQSVNILLISDIIAASEGSIPLEEGEDLWLIETDQGDGWTRSGDGDGVDSVQFSV